MNRRNFIRNVGLSGVNVVVPKDGFSQSDLGYGSKFVLEVLAQYRSERPLTFLEIAGQYRSLKASLKNGTEIKYRGFGDNWDALSDRQVISIVGKEQLRELKRVANRVLNMDRFRGRINQFSEEFTVPRGSRQWDTTRLCFLESGDLVELMIYDTSGPVIVLPNSLEIFKPYQELADLVLEDVQMYKKD